MAIDEARQQLRIGKVKDACGARRGHVGVCPDRGNASLPVYENGAILEGRRRDGMNPARSNPQQCYGVTPTPNGEWTWHT